MSPVRQRLLSIFGGSVGNLIEWYDFYVYSAFSLYFAQAFFPDADPLVQQLNTAGVFALGFLIRPVGGWLMGLYADLNGRRSALTLSVTLMCLGSLVIAICPTYARIGVAAPVVLMLARLLQGLSLGGEYGTSATYLSEVATSRHRGFYSSFQYVTLILGQLLATLTLLVLQRLLLTGPQLEAWGWRIPFGIGAALAIFGFYMRRNMVETEAFTREAAKKTGHGLPYALTVSLFGGTAEYVGTRLKLAGHEPWFFWYVTACIFCSLLVYTVMPDTQRHSRIDAAS